MLFRNAAPVPAVLARLRRFLGVSEVGGWPSEKLERRMGNGQRCEPPLAARVLPGIFVVVACASTRAAWRLPFNVASTTAGTFHGSRDDVSVDFMRSTRSLDVASLGPCRAARLPLVGTFDAVFILPRASGEAALRACISRIPELLATPYRQKLVDLWLPKRHLEFHTELNDAFREMGLRTLGDVERGDFSPLLGGTRQLYKSYFATLNLRLDERGVVASSQTVAVFRELRVTLGRPLLFHLNRPFIFCLSDRGSHSLQLVAAITQP